jgi:hypothetical protein
LELTDQSSPRLKTALRNQSLRRRFDLRSQSLETSIYETKVYICHIRLRLAFFAI